MHRIDTPTAMIDKFGQGKNGFTNGDTTTGRRATQLTDSYWDAIQEEVCTAIESAGIVLDKSKNDQLSKAIKSIINNNALLKANNLSDVEDKQAALANLAGVPTSRKVNGKVLTSDINLTASDVSALPISGGVLKGSLTISGELSSSGDIHSDKNIHSSGSIQAGTGLYDTPGIRVYSPNNKPSAFDVGAVRQGGVAGMGNNAVYLGWDGSKLIGQVDSTSMGAMFCTYNKPTPTDVNCIQRDSCDVSGFEGGDTTKPYMRRQGTNQSIYLATQLWVIQNFVQSVRLAGRTVIADSGGRVDLPSGCVYTGMSGANYAPGSWGAYSAIQILANGSWVTIGTA